MSVGTAARGPARLPAPAAAAGVLVAVVLAAWIVTVREMGGMDAGPATDPGRLPWFTALWLTMMVAMMLPSAAPMVMLFARVSRQRGRRGRALVPTWVFASGYFAVWTAYGLAAYGLYRAVEAADPGWLAWDAAGPYVAGAAVAAAGVYQATPLKHVCLRHCRGPLHFLMHGWREGRLGAVRMGATHGLYCVGCCWALMVVLFALGAMSILWMTVVAGVVFAEKVLPHGDRLSYLFAAALIGLGLWIALDPDSVPGLTDPLAARQMMEMAPMPGAMGGG